VLHAAAAASALPEEPGVDVDQDLHDFLLRVRLAR
jgi:hypothetical protein